MIKQGVREQQSSYQSYDISLKELVERGVEEVLPLLVPGVIYKETRNVEVARPMLRTDKVYVVLYCGKLHILHLEFEAGAKSKMAARMLAYNATLYHHYGLPVISIVIYLFNTNIIVSPLVIKGGDNTALITFHFRILPLFLLDAEHFVRERITCMYPLLPTMQGTNHVLLKQAMDELAELYSKDQLTLADIFTWMKVLLERTDTVTLDEKVRVKEALRMYDQLLNESPMIKRMLVESEHRGEAKGEARGEAKGQLRAAQRMLINIVSARFPNLTELARQNVMQMHDAAALDLLARKVAAAPDEGLTRWILSSTTP